MCKPNDSLIVTDDTDPCGIRRHWGLCHTGLRVSWTDAKNYLNNLDLQLLVLVIDEPIIFHHSQKHKLNETPVQLGKKTRSTSTSPFHLPARRDVKTNECNWCHYEITSITSKLVVPPFIQTQVTYNDVAMQRRWGAADVEKRGY